MSVRQVAKFLAVGLINTCTGLLIIYALKLFAGLGDVKANALGYAAGMIVSFSLNRTWTFGHPGAVWDSGIRFLATMIIAYALNLLVVLVALHAFEVNAYLAQAMGIPAFTIASYLLCRYWVFKTNGKK